MHWELSWRADPNARRIADGHYTRQKVGAKQFVPPGRCVVLVIPETCYWVTSWPYPEYVKHAWPGAWICSAFRNLRRCTVCDRLDGECDHSAETYAVHRSSDLITDALSATRFYWEPPDEGMITFVNAAKVRRKRDPGRCFLKAGFHVSGDKPGCWCVGRPRATEEEGLIACHLAADQMPAGCEPRGAQMMLGLGAL